MRAQHLGFVFLFSACLSAGTVTFNGSGQTNGNSQWYGTLNWAVPATELTCAATSSCAATVAQSLFDQATDMRSGQLTGMWPTDIGGLIAMLNNLLFGQGTLVQQQSDNSSSSDHAQFGSNAFDRTSVDDVTDAGTSSAPVSDHVTTGSDHVTGSDQGVSAPPPLHGPDFRPADGGSSDHPSAGEGDPPGSMSDVPEPAVWQLAALGLGLLGLRRLRRA